MVTAVIGDETEAVYRSDYEDISELKKSYYVAILWVGNYGVASKLMPLIFDPCARTCPTIKSS